MAERSLLPKTLFELYVFIASEDAGYENGRYGTPHAVADSAQWFDAQGLTALAAEAKNFGREASMDEDVADEDTSKSSKERCNIM